MSRRFWSTLVDELEPYTPGEQPRMAQLLKLNTNECPYPPPPAVMEAIQQVSGEALLRYPDPEACALRREIAAFEGLEPEQVFVGNGSDEVLAHVFMALLKHPGELLFPDISYSFYPVWCQLHQIAFRQIPLREDFTVAIDDYPIDAPAMILANPNAPTGVLLARESIEQLLIAAPDRLLVVDEAYIDFGGQSAVELVTRFDNLLVVQTLSKSRALAGLRVGVAFGDPQLIEALTRVKDSFNSYPLDVVAQRAATAAYRERAWFENTCKRIIASRENLAVALREMDFDVLPSHANFVFARHARLSGRALFDALRSRGIIVRRWDKPRIEEYLRITVGSEEECARFLEGLAEVLQALS